MIKLRAHRPVEPGERLAHGGHYYLRLREDNTLGVAAQTDPDPGEPPDYLEDFGRNISPDEIRELAGRWGRAGYCYRVTTLGGRHRHELPVFVALAAVLGELSGGSVMWMESVWFGVGVYPPGGFRRRLGRLCGPPALLPNANRAWITPAVVGVARGIGHDSAFDRLPALVDAPVDAGCDDQAILSHCRAGGPHVRNCWVVDFALSGEGARPKKAVVEAVESDNILRQQRSQLY